MSYIALQLVPLFPQIIVELAIAEQDFLDSSGGSLGLIRVDSDELSPLGDVSNRSIGLY